MEIAIIGGGAAGITAAHILQRKNRVTMFERNDYVGGHTHTIIIEEGEDRGTAVDTGFIVMNDRTYPTLHQFLAQLKVPYRNSDMSFGFYCERTGMQYSGRGISGLFARRRNLFKRSHWEMIRDIFRFNKAALQDLREGRTEGVLLGEYVKAFRFSDAFRDQYLIPMGAAIWSTPAEEMFAFPAETFLRFFENHGLLTVADRPQWQTVVGGSHSYVKAFLNAFQGVVETNAQIRAVERGEDDVTIHFHNQEPKTYDRVVIAVHADQVLPLLANPSDEERSVFSTWQYNENHTVLHTDETVMPPNKRAWASWNYTREQGAAGKQPLSVTYHMNRLQGFHTTNQYFVTLNRKQQIKPECIIREMQYTHPLFTEEAVKTQRRMKTMYGKQNTYYCGSYFGYGFHEDAVKSGVEAAKAMGMDL